ncbi:protein CASC3 [Conger conger]|uniref:protein CASC3 n=1 Tax=Conger conger TaxID=82655 RepID=UPI002A59E928|nr:protein CASC3 [Conger conger]
MADRRRRRKRASQDSEEEDESGSGTESGGSGSAGGKTRITVPEPVVVPTVRIRTKSEEESECESEDAIGEAVLSDYDSADPEDNGSHSEGEEEEEVVEGEKFSDEEGSKRPEPKSDTNKLAGDLVVEEEEEDEEEVVEEVEVEEEDEEGGGKEVKSDKKGNLAGERQSGDGQESTDDPENKSDSKAGKKLDDDEDRKNPAYIPRKGLFFEHDVRGQAHEEDIRPKGRHRKLWKDEGRWEHDKFREDEQAPKSREELIAMYGYDIRNANGPCDGRPFRSRKPRYSSSPGREKRWRDGEKLSRSSWHCSGNSGTTTAIVQSSSVASPSGPVPPLPRIQGGGGRTSSHPQIRNFQGNRPPQNSYRSYKPLEENSHQHNSLQHQGVFGRGSHKHHPEMEQGPARRGREAETEHSPAVVVEDERYTEEEPVKPQQQQQQQQPSYYSVKLSERDPLPNRRREDTQSEPALLRDTTPATATAPERTVERKSYSLARRTRTKPSELGKQVSLEESVPPVPPPAQPALSTEKNEAWETREESSGVQGGLTGLDQDLARLSLAGQNWAQSPPSYLRAEMRGIPNSIHMAGGPPQYNRMEEMGVGGGRAKRYSSQRQRPVPEPAPMHIGIMEGHYYEPMSFQGPIYAHSDSPTPLAPQGMLVQPEMHLTHPGHPGHPGLHPHQSGAPMPNPAMYAGPPVSMSPGQPPPQQLLAPPFYPPPGVMTFGNTNFPYAAGATLPPIYPNPQAQAQVYGGVTYYDTMQQQAQPKPSPPRRSSQPVTIKPPPPEVPFIVPE